MQELLTRTAQPLGQLHGPAEERHAHQRRLASLPGDGDVPVGLGADVLAQVLGQQVLGHAEPVSRVEGLLREEEAVLAVQIADGTRGLGQDVERYAQGARRWRGRRAGMRGCDGHRYRNTGPPITHRCGLG